MKYFVFVLLFISVVSGQGATAAVTPTAPLPWHDTAASLSVKLPTLTTKKKPGFFGKLKATLLSFIVKKEATKQSADVKKILGIAALSFIVIGLGVPLLGGPAAFLALVPASLVTAIVALVVKDGRGDNMPAADGKRKRKSNTAAITALIISGGLLLFFAGLAIAFSGGHW
ncbi:MAG: hypothetical protein M3Q06_06795 [Bacteroidota bacterium]|nr:hypothetical protein [Bacteroidota bacterium]